jgi:hypothetical protein
MSSNPSAEQRIADMNQEVAAYQRAGKIEEGVKLADEAFFSALKELPEGHFLRAQSARNRGIMQFMNGNNEEAIKTSLVALDFYGKTLQATTRRREELENSGKYLEALAEAKEEAKLARTIEQLQQTLFGDKADE